MSLNKCFPCLNIQNEEVTTKLDFSNTSLTDVFPDVWQYERTLEELYLTSTRLNNLPPQLFYCQSLRILMINNNNLESLPTAIGSLRQLQQLNLSRNLISNVPDNIKACKNLTHLDLSCNNLQRLPDAITCLISLQELFLNETYLEFLPANFGRLVNLTILELRLNNLITLPKSIVRLINLQRIDIGGNEFTELPEVIGELKNLRELWIDLNQIRRVSTNIGKLRELQHFEANGNLINTLPSEISNWKNIEVISLCTNYLNSLPFSLGMMKSLVTLKCESNELHELPESISNLENLEELVLSHNQLYQLPATIGTLKKLRFLFVDDNELQALPKELCACSSLTVLSVSRNKITELPTHIGQLTHLKVINIVNNNISTLPVSILNLLNLTSLWISDNQSQPLVPLQYLNGNTKTHLTCFMLPQIGSEANQNPEHIYHKEKGEHILDIENEFTSQSRRICFAEEATVLAAVGGQKINDICNSKSVNSKLSNSTIAPASIAIEEQLGARLMRSPTPYPKELRLMSKYIRNGHQKLTQKTPEILNIKEARVMFNNPNNCDTNNFSNNDIQSYVNENNFLVTKNTMNDSFSLAYQSSQVNMNIVTQQRSNQLINFPQMLTEDQCQQPQFYTAYYIAPSLNNTEPKVISYSPELNHLQAQTHNSLLNHDGSGNIENILQPPPYHIAKVFTKKSPEDLTNYEAMRNQNQILSQQCGSGSLEHTHQQEDGNLKYANKIDSNCTQFPNIKPIEFIVDSDYENNVLENHDSSEKEFKSEYKNDGVTVTSLPQLEQKPLTTNDNQQLYQHSPTSSATPQISSSSEKNSIKRTPWIFGVHKNPTVKQVTIKWENNIGFDIKEMPNKGGIVVASTALNSNAAQVLCVNDKLLEVDNYDFTNIHINDARNIILTAPPVVNITLSRI